MILLQQLMHAQRFLGAVAGLLSASSLLLILGIESEVLGIKEKGACFRHLLQQ